ncbi:MAG: peptidoglycan-binding domain-containing protein [Saprospiraceae bacterium]|nr:peptidoglycan-binding domain-containing protein [Saprospiraceae bacterium]
MLKQIVLLVVLSILFAQCSSYQFREGYKEKGECFAKCLIVQYDELGSVGEENSMAIAIQQDYVDKEVIIEPASKKWEKKKADRNCLSNNPEDCLVWCLIETPAKTRTVRYHRDSIPSDVKFLEKKKDLELPKESYEWRAVVCAHQITKGLIIQIQNRLYALGYNDSESTGRMNKETRKGLVAFQKDNRLPIGHMDYETLDRLGVK